MNSLLKQTLDTRTENPESFVTKFEKNLTVADLVEAELTMTKLKFLGLNFDPFNQEVSQECQQVMDNLGLTEHLKNPYEATNLLLRLLDKAEERINNLKQ